jgi:hypothetical protein
MAARRFPLPARDPRLDLHDPLQVTVSENGSEAGAARL